MRATKVGANPDVLDVHTFAHLFIRLRLLRRGVVLDRPDGHVLLRPNQLPAERFVAPQASFDAQGAHYRFWMFDTDRMEPSYWEVRVATDGTTSYTEGQ
jgi:hypothetical protein